MSPFDLRTLRCCKFVKAVQLETWYAQREWIQLQISWFCPDLAGQSKFEGSSQAYLQDTGQNQFPQSHPARISSCLILSFSSSQWCHRNKTTLIKKCFEGTNYVSKKLWLMMRIDEDYSKKPKAFFWQQWPSCPNICPQSNQWCTFSFKTVAELCQCVTIMGCTSQCACNFSWTDVQCANGKYPILRGLPLFASLN